MTTKFFQKIALVTLVAVSLSACMTSPGQYMSSGVSGSRNTGWQAGESLDESQDRSGDMDSGETQSDHGTTDDGGDAGFGAISG